MNNRMAIFMRTARGPVLLITFGALAALHQSGAASFGKTWPLLLIVFGLWRLLERLIAPAYVYAPSSLPGAQPPVASAIADSRQPPPPPAAGVRS